MSIVFPSLTTEPHVDAVAGDRLLGAATISDADFESMPCPSGGGSASGDQHRERKSAASSVRTGSSGAAGGQAAFIATRSAGNGTDPRSRG